MIRFSVIPLMGLFMIGFIYFVIRSAYILYKRRERSRAWIRSRLFSWIAGNINMILHGRYGEISFHTGKDCLKPEQIVGMSVKKIQTISVCLIVQNAEDTIELCLRSVEAFADEIIVIDGGSTDGTPDIVRTFTDKLIFNKWRGNHSEQRNIYLRHATGDWIFVIDADEFAPPGFRDFIPKFMNLDYVSYWFPRYWLLSNPDGLKVIKSDVLFPDYSHRLFRNRKNIYYRGEIHEELCGLKGKAAKLPDFPIYHMDLLLHNRDEREKKVEKYSARDLRSAGETTYLFEEYPYQLTKVNSEALGTLFNQWFSENIKTMKK